MGFAEKRLSETRRIEIASGLYKVKNKPTSKGELNGLCPFHEDKNPSFSYNYKKDTYTCLTCHETGNLIKLWSHVNCPGADEKAAFKAFCKEFNISSNASHDTQHASDDAPYNREHALERMKKVWELYPPLPAAMIKKLEKSRGWSEEIIKKLDLRLETQRMNKVGKLINVGKQERIAIAIYDAVGDLVNIRLYHPGAKQYKIVSFGVGLGLSRLFPARPNNLELVILCEGESDTICALSHGLNAITQTSKLVDWPKEHIAVFKSRDVFIAYDADEPGQKYAHHAAQTLKGAAKSVWMVQWPSYMMEGGEAGKLAAKHGQDLTDFFVRHGKTADDFAPLLKSAQLYDPATDPYRDSAATAAPDAPVPLDFFARGVNDRLSFKPRLLAEKIMGEHKLISDPTTGLLYEWNGKFLEIFDEDHLKAAAIKYLGSESQKSRVEDAVYQILKMATIPQGRQVNDQSDWICLQNGMLNFLTFEMRPHDSEFYSTYALPISFDPNSAKRCTRWEQYLSETIQTAGPIAQAQEFAGYCLTRYTKYEKCLLLYGPGADGKSTFMKTLKLMVGNENCAAVSFASLENEFHRSSLYNKLLNISTEVGATAIESPYFKAITSGDPIDAAFKHQNSFTFEPFCKLIFAGNVMPRVKDNSDGFFRKILPIHFKRQFKEGDPDRDPELLDKLEEELSEIFYWALCGLKRLTEQRMFTNCDETKELLMGYRRSNNPVLCYLEDELVVGNEYEISKSDIYSHYRKYCSEGGYMPISRENFFRELYAAVHNLQIYKPERDGKRDRIVKGIGLKEASNE
jgi:putative DNA primase/helicase